MVVMFESKCVVEIKEDGRVLVPASIRKALNLPQGGKVILHVTKDGTLHVIPFRKAIERAQDLFRRLVPEGGGNVVDEFIAERREEARKEDEEYFR
jgi:AbrB family looped-hinge helix DNA binding protein